MAQTTSRRSPASLGGVTKEEASRAGRLQATDATASSHGSPAGSLIDSYGRIAKKLRIQVTDRCNYSCDFCMPPRPAWLDRAEILTFEEIARTTRLLAGMGVEKVRLSGGEPLVRQDVEKLVRLLVEISGIKNVSLTTNGSKLKQMAFALKENGLSGATVSLHSLKADRYEATTGVRDMLPRVLDGIDEALRLKIPLKINCVIRRGDNEDEIPDFVRLARRLAVPVRFIEYMPFDGKRFWSAERVVSGAEMVRRASEVSGLVPIARERGGTANRYGFQDGSGGEVDTITSMTMPFCGDCDRIRLTADGKIVPCLFSKEEYDLKSLLRRGAAEGSIADEIQGWFLHKFSGVESMLRDNVTFERVRPMSTIGG